MTRFAVVQARDEVPRSQIVPVLVAKHADFLCSVGIILYSLARLSEPVNSLQVHKPGPN
jgi:hypothetical protein